MPPATAPTDAKGVLESALQQWTQGKQAADLRQNPADSVLVRDEDWEAGNVLGSFKLLDQGEPFGNDVRFKVELKLTTPAATKKVRYTVSTQPARVIMRDDSME